VKNPKEAAQIFVSGARDVLIDTARSEEQKCAAKLTLADSQFLGGRSIYGKKRRARKYPDEEQRIHGLLLDKKK
jgi:hypothetical protein